MGSSCLLGQVRPGTRVIFHLPNDELQIYATASIEQVSAVERFMHVELIKNKASCCHGTMEFAALVEHNGTVSEIPVKIAEDEISGQNKVSAGALNITHFRLKLTHLELTKEVRAKLYNGIVAKDEACMSEAITATDQGGSGARKKLGDLVDDGCIELTPYVMTTSDGSPSKVHVIRGKKISYAYLFPASWAESPKTTLNGWILEGLVRGGNELTTYVLQESPVSDLIPVNQR